MNGGRADRQLAHQRTGLRFSTGSGALSAREPWERRHFMLDHRRSKTKVKSPGTSKPPRSTDVYRSWNLGPTFAAGGRGSLHPTASGRAAGTDCEPARPTVGGPTRLWASALYSSGCSPAGARSGTASAPSHEVNSTSSAPAVQPADAHYSPVVLGPQRASSAEEQRSSTVLLRNRTGHEQARRRISSSELPSQPGR